jgi:hypothetical protein
MSSIHVSDDTLTVRLSPLSKLAGLLRDQVVPLSAVTGVEVVPDGLAAARGLRAPGLALPGRRRVGTWRGRGVRRFVDVRRGQPALRLHLQGLRYDELLLGHDAATSLAGRLAVRHRPTTTRGPERCEH